MNELDQKAYVAYLGECQSQLDAIFDSIVRVVRPDRRTREWGQRFFQYHVFSSLTYRPA